MPTGFSAEHLPANAVSAITPSPLHRALAAVALYAGDAQALAAEHGISPEMIGWHSSHEAPAIYQLQWREEKSKLEVLVHDGHLFSVIFGEETMVIDVLRHDGDVFSYRHNGVQSKARLPRDGDALWLEAEGRTWGYKDVSLAPVASAAAGSDGRLLAHSDGKVVVVHVAAGEAVTAGQTLAVLEAMKMEFQLKLPVAGVVESVSVSAGQQVKNRQVLVVVEPSA